MLATVFLLVTSLAGFAMVTRAVPWAPAIVRMPAGFFVALVLSSASMYAIAAGFADQTAQSLRIGMIVTTLVAGLVFWALGRRLTRDDFRMPGIDKAVTAISLGFGAWIVNERLQEIDGLVRVSGNAWSDFSLHLGLSRSFAVGSNYPTEYPFFSGEPIRYHFGFDFFAGALQKGGFSVLGAFNLPGAIGFATMLMVTFALARLLFSPVEPVRWFRDRGVWSGLIAMVLLVTNQSLSWMRYLENTAGGNILKAFDPNTWGQQNGYAAKGPYSDDPIAIFNSLNPYLAQTHLITQVALVLLVAYLIIGLLRDGDGLSKRLMLGIGVVFGMAFWQNGVVWLAGSVFFAALIGVWAVSAIWTRVRAKHEEADTNLRTRKVIRLEATKWVKIGLCFAIPALIVGIPQALTLSSGGEGSGLNTHLGYLACMPTAASCTGGTVNLLSPGDWWTWIGYWWVNEGAFLPLLILAFIVGTSRDRKIIAATTVMFLWGNVFVVGNDVGGFNHKLFNLWEALNGVFVGYAVVTIWVAIRTRLKRRPVRIVARTATLAVGFFLIASGLVDFMTIRNDVKVEVFGDEPQRQATDWIVRQTERDATFLTDFDQTYQPPAMAGRRVALGYSPWAATSGYEVEPRKKVVADIYAATDRSIACTLMKENGIDYVLVGPLERRSERFKINAPMWADMTSEITFGAAENEYKIYKTVANCA